jgi:hypothetical protein
MLPTMLSVDVRRNYDMILERFGLRTLHSRRRHLDYCNVFNNKTDCQSIMDTANLRVPSKLIRDFSIFSVSKVLRSNNLARCSTLANNIYQVIDLFSTKTVSLGGFVLCYLSYYCVLLYFYSSFCICSHTNLYQQ